MRDLSHQDREVTLTLTPRLVSNDLSTLKHAAVNGMGIAALPAYVCEVSCAAGS
jgi:hypothetical protein